MDVDDRPQTAFTSLINRILGLPYLHLRQIGETNKFIIIILMNEIY